MRNDIDQDDPVIEAFIAACPRPTAQDIIEWIERYPDRADDIRDAAEIALSLDAQYDANRVPSPELLKRIDEMCDATFGQYWAEAQAERVKTATFRSLMADSGKGLPAVARELDIGRAALTDLVQGRMTVPLPARFAAALAEAFFTTAEVIAAAAGRAVAHPHMGRAKANAAPNGRQRTFADIVRDDPTMSAERKAFWLAEG